MQTYLSFGRERSCGLLGASLVVCALLCACGAGSGAERAGAAGSSGAPGSASGSPGTSAGRGGANASGSTGAGGISGSSAGSGEAGAVAGSGGGLAGAGGASGGAGGATNLPATTVWIAGDSTVMTYAAGNTSGDNGTSLEGWGQELGSFFTSKVTINNQAIGGRSVAFFMWSVVTDSTGAYQCVDTQGTPEFKMSNGAKVDTSQWAKIKSGIKAGDFLLIQFGTNDETHDCPRFVSTADFATDLGFMADTVRAKGATPIFVTPMGHRTFSGAKFNNTLLPYANAMKIEATAKNAEVVDLNLRSGEYYESVGTTYLATNIFDGGTTHFIKAGAIEMATLIVGELKNNKGPLAAYLK